MRLEIILLEMNHKISVYNVDRRVVINLLLALIVQCRYGFLLQSFAQIQYHTFGIGQYANRYAKAS